MRSQRADVRREFDWKHRDGAVRKIDAGAAHSGFTIDRRARAYIVAHVGDVNLQRKVAVGESLHPDGVIKVTRRLTVDRNDVEVAEIAPAPILFLRDLSYDRSRLVQHVVREMMGDPMGTNEDFDVNAEIIRVAKDFDDLPEGPLPFFPVIEN